MKTRQSVRAVEEAAPGCEETPDFEVEEMDGFYELGMHRRTHRLARRILNRPHLTAEAFSRTVGHLLSCVTKIESWIPIVETAWTRLSPGAQKRARLHMLGFLNTVDALDQALPLATVRPEDSFDLMNSLAAFTYHHKEEEACQLVELAEKLMRVVDHPFEVGLVYRAIAHYYSAKEEWGSALRAWSRIPAQSTFIEEQHLGMAEALRRMGEQALGGLSKLADSELALSNPDLDPWLIAQARRRLNRLRRSLAWVNAKKAN